MGKYQKRLFPLVVTVVASFCFISVNSCTHQPYVLPENLRTYAPNICFELDVLPVLQSNCAKSGCHDATSHRGGYRLDSYADIMSKGIVPGNPSASKIWQSIAINKGENFMPQDGPALNPAQLDVIKRWITAGAVDSGACNINTCDTTIYTYSGAVAPIMQTYCTGCHNSASAPGGSLMDYASVYAAAVNGRLIGDISHLSGYNPMPNNGGTLLDCQVTQIKKWVAAGAPNN